MYGTPVIISQREACSLGHLQFLKVLSTSSLDGTHKGNVEMHLSIDTLYDIINYNGGITVEFYTQAPAPSTLIHFIIDDPYKLIAFFEKHVNGLPYLNNGILNLEIEYLSNEAYVLFRAYNNPREALEILTSNTY